VQQMPHRLTVCAGGPSQPRTPLPLLILLAAACCHWGAPGALAATFTVVNINGERRFGAGMKG
jgi:hypothetical protein